MITLGDLKNLLPEAIANDSINDKVADFAYWTLKDILKYPDYWWNKKKTSFTTVNGQAEYFLSSKVIGHSILWMGDEARESHEIHKVDLQQIYRSDSTPTDTGDPEVWAPVEQSETQSANTSGTISVVSTSSADVGINLIVQGQVSGLDRFETLSLKGTTSSSANSPLTWDADSIKSVTLQDKPSGAVTVSCNGSVIAEISPKHKRIQCPRIRLWRVPSSVLTLPYIYKQDALYPIHDGAIIDIPDYGFDAMLAGITKWGSWHNGDTEEFDYYEKIFRIKQDELRSLSEREFQGLPTKDFRKKLAGVPFTLPRTIDATVS